MVIIYDPKLQIASEFWQLLWSLSECKLGKNMGGSCVVYSSLKSVFLMVVLLSFNSTGESVQWGDGQRTRGHSWHHRTWTHHCSLWNGEHLQLHLCVNQTLTSLTHVRSEVPEMQAKTNTTECIFAYILLAITALVFTCTNEGVVFPLGTLGMHIT